MSSNGKKIKTTELTNIDTKRKLILPKYKTKYEKLVSTPLDKIARFHYTSLVTLYIPQKRYSHSELNYFLAKSCTFVFRKNNLYFANKLIISFNLLLMFTTLLLIILSNQCLNLPALVLQPTNPLACMNTFMWPPDPFITEILKLRKPLLI